MAASGFRAELADRAVGVRTRALAYLVSNEGAPARYVPELNERILDPDPGLRGTAVVALGQAGRPGVDGLIRALSPRQPADVRLQAANSLAGIGPDAEDAVPALCACLFTKSEDLRSQASWALGQIGEPSVEPLTRLITTTEDPLALAAASDAIGYIGPPAKPAMQDLKALFRSEHPSVRIAAFSAVQQIRAKPGRHLKRIVQLTWHEEATVRHDALRRIGEHRVNGQNALPRVLELLEDPDPEIRAEAAYVMARIEADPAESADALVPLLRDPVADVRTAAAAALHAFGPPAASALPELESRFTDQDPGVVVAARAAAAKIGALVESESQ